MKLMTSPTLLILAAGMGNRYGGLKQIEPVSPGGETILDYSIYDALRAGFNKAVFVIRKEIEQPFREIIGARFEKQIAVEYVFQELDKLPPRFSAPPGRTKPWGTAHAVLMATDTITAPFAVINADDYYGAAGFRSLATHFQSGASDYAMIGFVLRNTLSEFGPVSRGVCSVTSDGFLEGVVELTKIERNHEGKIFSTGEPGQTIELSGNELVSMNMWGFTPAVFQQLRERFQHFLESNGNGLQAECYLPSAINDLVVDGRARIKVLPSQDSWFGVTYREDLPRVIKEISNLIDDGSYPRRLWA
jgi:NDP-sugar pyrophosphorylase family protein